MIHLINTLLFKIQIEDFMWETLNSGEDIPADLKDWMEKKLVGRDKEILAKFISKCESDEKLYIYLLGEMGIKVDKTTTEPQTVEVEVDPSPDLKEQLQSKREEYMVFHRIFLLLFVYPGVIRGYL